MKNLLVFALMVIITVSCNKQASDQLAPESVSKTSAKFYNQDKKKDVPKNVKGELVFKLKDNSSLKSIGWNLKTTHITNKSMEKSGYNGYYKLYTNNEEAIVEQLKLDSRVEWASLIPIVETQVVPDDVYYNNGSMYGMNNINAPAAWASGNVGSKQVVVAVIDEGIFSHDDLCGNIWRNPYELDNGIDDDGNGYIDDFHGWNWFSNNNLIYPGATHGTHVAGTIGAKINNQIGVVGVSPNVTIISCKFLEGSGSVEGAVQALDYLIDLKQRHGINIKLTSNSWGGGGYYQPFIDALHRAEAADILNVFAAGNSNNNNDADKSPSFPGAYSDVVPNMITVGASDAGNFRAGFSSYGKTTCHLFAPGVAIVSTVPSDQHTSAYAFFNGTSMATPHVTGGLALLSGIHPEYNWRQLKDTLLSRARKLPQLLNFCQGNSQGGNFLDVSSFTGHTDENQPPFYECPIITPDQNAPTVPQNFEVYDVGFNPEPGAFHGGFFGIRWQPSTDPEGNLAGYYFWINGTPYWFLGGTNYSIAGLDTSGQPMICWVQSTDAWGNVSAFSNPDTAIWSGGGTPPPPAPDTQAPTLNGNGSFSNITVASITFNHPAASDNKAVTGYTINWRASGGVWLQRSSNNLSETFSNLSSNTTYEFYYTARDAAGNVSAPSATISATTLGDTPPPPTCNITSNNLNATSQSLNVTLSWTINVSGGCTVSSTRLERKKGGTASYSAVAFDPTSPYHDIVPNPGNYTYRLQIVSSTGQTTYSNEKTVKVNKK